MTPEQLKAHRELEVLRAAGRYSKRRRPANSQRRAANKARIARRIRKLEQTRG